MAIDKVRKAGSQQAFEFPSGNIDPNWMISARSYLVDRFVADFERILLPPKRLSGGNITYIEVQRSVPPQSPRRNLLRPAPLKSKVQVSGTFVDLRKDSPDNWAHFVSIHLPIVFHLMSIYGIEFEDLTLILPADTPSHIGRAAALFGFPTLCIDEPVVGRGIRYELSHLEATRSRRAEWVHYGFVQKRLSEKKRPTQKLAELPKRLFLSRKDTRRITNERAIEGVLSTLGFEKRYAEDLKPIDQFRAFEEAETIVAVHGAAIAPLLYRPMNAKPLSFVEVFPCGHITDVWRSVAQQVGARWIGVRGKIKSEHIREVYRHEKPFLRYSLQDYEVDPESVLFALKWINIPAPDHDSEL